VLLTWPGDAYQWVRADTADTMAGGNTTDVPGATGSRYLIGATDDLRFLSVRVIATDNGEE
jgi:hypothetical protein